ncbi:MAG: alpha/beta hydrolase [Synechococcus sp. SB0665_bin_28]|nr:alpha/beta hydrolase [Synechococcus sp. SB0665_bin_28]MYF20173.1 alpha/beta hydrolase [Synechococcus sp. SB0677_bin_5]
MTLQILAMHGWSSQAEHWQPWVEAFAANGWRCRCGERGYGPQPPAMPGWGQEGLRVVMASSMGIHLVDEALLAAAEAVVLLASFGRFVPQGHPGTGRRLQLAAMDQYLRRGDVAGLFARFRVQVAAPLPVDCLPEGLPAEAVSAAGIQRLRDDLTKLGQLQDLPPSFPRQAPVLNVEAAEDHIVHPLARQALRQALPTADHLLLSGSGHALLDEGLIPRVVTWLEKLPGPTTSLR